MIRLYVPDQLEADVEVVPSAEQARYLAAVMRLAVGDIVALFNGRDGEWRAAASQVSKRGVRLRLEARTRAQETASDLDLVVALVKRARLETIVEKATELGVGRIRLALTHRTNADHTNVGRLQAIATEAAEQTGRLDVPQILAPQGLDVLLNDWSPSRRLMFCDEAGDARPAAQALAPAAGDEFEGPWAVLIGPEGGFSPPERERLRGLDFVTPVSLGPRVLRADTAAIAALALWQAARGDWRG